MRTRTAYCLLDAGGRVLAAHEELHPFYAASTVKLALMAAVARAVDGGELRWTDEVEVRSEFPSGAAGAPRFQVPPADRDRRMPPDGEPATVLELVHAMIRRSSNEATNLLAEVVGLPSVAVVMDDAGAVGCRMERLIGDVAASEAGITNEVTAEGLARLMIAVVTGRLASPGSTEVMVDTLRGQELPCIADVLPPGAMWGSKSGWVEGIDHDVAFIGDPGTPVLKVLAVCTSGFPQRTGEAEIRYVSSMLMSEGNRL